MVSRTIAILSLGLLSHSVWAAGPAGLVAEWNFDEGQGPVARDSSGNSHDAQIDGAAWVEQRSGFALSVNGTDDYVDCGAGAQLSIGGPVTFELWVKPMRKAHGESVIFGDRYDDELMPRTSALLTYYNGEHTYWYIGNGGNGISGQLRFKQWNHVVATFDGKSMNLWINGRLAASRESRVADYEPRGHLLMGAK